MPKKILKGYDVIDNFVGENLLPVVLGWAFVNVTITLFLEAHR